MGKCQGVIVREKGSAWEITINTVVNYFIQKPMLSWKPFWEGLFPATGS
jgi:hypothetical protein